MGTFAEKVNFGSFLKGLCGEDNYDRLQELNKKPPEISGGINNKADSAILKPPKSDGNHLHPIISGSPNLHKQKGDPMSQNSKHIKENFNKNLPFCVLGGDL